jgi:hypothetical protein
LNFKEEAFKLETGYIVYIYYWGLKVSVGRKYFGP